MRSTARRSCFAIRLGHARHVGHAVNSGGALSSNSPRGPVRKVAIVVAFAIVGLGIALGFVFSSPSWKSDVTMTAFSGRYDDSSLEVCGNGHFDQGLMGEVLYRFGMGPSDNGASQCVAIEFAGKVRAGTFALRGRGHHLMGEVTAPFSPGPGHAVEVKRVTSTLSCFCSPSDELATFDGVLTLDDVAPPRGHLQLTVTTSRKLEFALDVPLRRFKWESRSSGY